MDKKYIICCIDDNGRRIDKIWISENIEAVSKIINYTETLIKKDANFEKDRTEEESEFVENIKYYICKIEEVIGFKIEDRKLIMTRDKIEEENKKEEIPEVKEEIPEEKPIVNDTRIKDYLGDGVYIIFDPDLQGFWLYANHHENPTDRIYIDRHVLASLMRLLSIHKKEEPLKNK